MKAIIIYQDNKKIEGGIYNGISYETAAAEIGENNILLYIALTVSGATYADRKNDLRDKAIEWSLTQGEYAAWSYGELGTISDFFENNGRRYGLLNEFRENAII